jgi:hypothetical protein
MSGYLTITTAGLPATISSALKFTSRSVFGADGQFDGAVVDAAVLTGQHAEGTIRRALETCRNQCRPGGHRVAAEALTILERRTVGAKQNEADQELRGAAYANDLAQYPADVIQVACQRWADSSRWWPAWADLKRECDRLAAKRIAEHRALEEALRRLSTPARPQLAAPAPLATLQERLRTSVLLRRQAGDTRTAAHFEVKLAKAQNRPVKKWAEDAIAEQVAEQKAKAAEYQRVADEQAAQAPAPTPSKSDLTLAELAQRRRDAMLGIDRSEVAA